MRTVLLFCVLLSGLMFTACGVAHAAPNVPNVPAAPLGATPTYASYPATPTYPPSSGPGSVCDSGCPVTPLPTTHP